jgi:hypothetical protein
MTTDPKNNQSVCTPIFALAIAGSIEDKMYRALRDKKSFADVALQDIDRKGHQAFIDELVDSMGTTGDFDAEDMAARIVCGIAPYARLTATLPRNKIMAKYGIKKADFEMFISQNEEVNKAYNYLIGQIQND